MKQLSTMTAIRLLEKFTDWQKSHNEQEAGMFDYIYFLETLNKKHHVKSSVQVK